MTCEEDYMERAIAEREALLRLKAADRVHDPAMWEDVLNEGRIAIWDVLTKRPDADSRYVSAAMSNRMTSAASRDDWTGKPSQQGRVEASRRTVASFDDPDFAWEPAAPDLLDDVLRAYHHGELMAALNQLTPRQRHYVYSRFWEGKTNAEIAAELDTTAKALNASWNNYTRPALRQMLEVLHAGA